MSACYLALPPAGENLRVCSHVEGRCQRRARVRGWLECGLGVVRLLLPALAGCGNYSASSARSWFFNQLLPFILNTPKAKEPL